MEQPHGGDRQLWRPCLPQAAAGGGCLALPVAALHLLPVPLPPHPSPLIPCCAESVDMELQSSVSSFLNCAVRCAGNGRGSCGVAAHQLAVRQLRQDVAAPDASANAPRCAAQSPAAALPSPRASPLPTAGGFVCTAHTPTLPLLACSVVWSLVVVVAVSPGILAAILPLSVSYYFIQASIGAACWASLCWWQQRTAVCPWLGGSLPSAAQGWNVRGRRCRCGCCPSRGLPASIPLHPACRPATSGRLVRSSGWTPWPSPPSSDTLARRCRWACPKQRGLLQKGPSKGP